MVRIIKCMEKCYQLFYLSGFIFNPGTMMTMQNVTYEHWAAKVNIGNILTWQSHNSFNGIVSWHQIH